MLISNTQREREYFPTRFPSFGVGMLRVSFIPTTLPRRSGRQLFKVQRLNEPFSHPLEFMFGIFRQMGIYAFLLQRIINIGASITKSKKSNTIPLLTPEYRFISVGGF